MKTYRLRYTGEPAWLIVIAILTLWLACFPAFLYWLYFLQVDVTETPPAAVAYPAPAAPAPAPTAPPPAGA